MNQEKIMPLIEKSEQALLDTKQVLDGLGIVFILDGGTLLGFYRDGTFAQDDHDDIDLTCSWNAWAKIHSIVRAMMTRGFTVYHEWTRSPYNKCSGQISFKRDNVKIDIMFKEEDVEKQKVWWTVYGGPQGKTFKSVPTDLIKETQVIYLNIAGKQKEMFRIPEKVDEYLAYRYGEWQIPLHRSEYSCYTTDKSIVQPNEYEAI